MLKINDNVNYKEFYKYGFTRPQYLSVLVKTAKLGRGLEDQNFYTINLKTKEVSVSTLDGRVTLDDTLYDLIKAGLIVGDGENGK